MNFLQLCQRVASDSGTVSGDAKPAAVAGQTGRLGKIVRWTNDAWRDIQNARNGWLWMQEEFENDVLLSGVSTYNAAAMGISARFADWMIEQSDPLKSGFSAYLTATGKDDETPLKFVTWRDFRFVRARGAAATNPGKPSEFTVMPDLSLRFYPVPDAAYTVSGLYRKSVQELTADADIPEMPERFHSLIVTGALIAYLGTDDEATVQLPLWAGLRSNPQRFALERDQLPRISADREFGP